MKMSLFLICYYHLNGTIAKDIVIDITGCRKTRHHVHYVLSFIGFPVPNVPLILICAEVPHGLSSLKGFPAVTADVPAVLYTLYLLYSVQQLLWKGNLWDIKFLGSQKNVRLINDIEPLPDWNTQQHKQFHRFLLAAVLIAEISICLLPIVFR